MAAERGDEILSGFAYLRDSQPHVYKNIARAVRNAADDPDEAIAKVRDVLETLLRDAARKLKCAAADGPLEQLAGDKAMTQSLPRRLAARLQGLLSLCRLDPDEAAKLDPDDVYAALTDLREVAEWCRDAGKALAAPGAASVPGLGWTRQEPVVTLRIKVLDRFRFYAHYRWQFQDALTREFDWKEKSRAFAVLALNELVDNAFEHGSKGQGDKSVTVHLEMAGQALSITVTDEGSGFDMEKAIVERLQPDPRRRRGRGLVMLKRIASDLISANGGRTVRVVLDPRRLESGIAAAPAARALPRKAPARRPPPDYAAAGFTPLAPAEVFSAPTLDELIRNLQESGL